MTKKIVAQCAYDGCLKTLVHRGYCNAHYQHLRNSGALPRLHMSRQGECAEIGCNKPIQSKGLCRRHYYLLVTHGDSQVYKKVARDAPMSERFWSRVALTANDSRCWEWTGYLNPNGYGDVWIDTVRYRAHRYAWFLIKGYHPTLFLCHTCDNRKCVNPKHLYEGTNRDNVNDILERGNPRWMQYLPRERYEAIKQALETQTIVSVMKTFGYSEGLISAIKHNRHWTNKIYAPPN